MRVGFKNEPTKPITDEFASEPFKVGFHSKVLPTISTVLTIDNG